VARPWRVLFCALAAFAASSIACGKGRSALTLPDPLPYEGSRDDQLVGITAAVPGFAGFYYDPYPASYIALVDPREADAARLEVARVLKVDTSIAGIRTVKYSFAWLKTWEQAVQRRCMQLPGVQSFDADEFHNKVRVGVVADGGSVDDVRACGLAAGAPGDALDVEAEGQILLR
jgi:hypothetical protein